jgi:hypothetical protein
MLHSQSHRVTVLRFLETQSVVTPTEEQRLDDLARHLIDVMAVRDCHRWDAEIAWQSARETQSPMPDVDLQEIIDRVQWQLPAQ